jgi:nucleoside-triphosphatase THEP1
MPDYDFNSLNDKEFESLSNDVLSSHLSVRIERFKAGRDGGVDGRFFATPDNEVIIQCKHWIKSGLPALMNSIKKSEAEKVKKLAPSRYIFITSLELSRVNKIKIKKIFAPYILNEDDIFGNEDLNDLLATHPEIEKRYYKLWITSTNVLKIILNAAIVGRSKSKLEEIVEESSRYVYTQSHRDAIKKLETKNSIIITGAPGVGKTSLADQLSQYYVAKGYELCFIENSLNEAEEYYNEECYQVFYFDDFLGRNFLLALGNHQDSQVINFISRINRDSKKRFILTSRSNVLNQGRRLSDLFEIKKIERNEYEVSIAKLLKFDKAQILYNHIWFSQLDNGFIDEVYKEKRYLKIIDHENFNPRLISFITDSHRLEAINHSAYWSYIEKTLENPQGIWGNVFDIQIDKLSRHMVIAVSIHGTSISESNLNKFYMNLSVSRLNSGDNITFDTTVRLLVGALLNRNIIDKNTIQYDLFNPSIADYVLSNQMGDINYIDELLACLGTKEAIYNIYSFYKSGGVDKAYFSSLLEKQLLRDSEKKDKFSLDEYLLTLMFLATSEIEIPKDGLLDYITELSEAILTSSEITADYRLFEFVNWAIEIQIVSESDSRLKKLLSIWVVDIYVDQDEFEALSKLIIRVEPNGEDELTNQFKTQYVDYVSDVITSDVIESGIFANEYDNSYSENELYDFIDERLSFVSIKFQRSDIEKISECFDIDDIIQSNVNAAMNDDKGYDELRDGEFSTASSMSPIDDLFDRS